MSLLESERVRDLLERAGLGDLSPKRVRAVVLLAAIVAGFALWRFWPSPPAAEATFDAGSEPVASSESTPSPPPEVVVHVAGAVMRPGVYRLAPGSRVNEAIAIAGGGLGSAALDSLNLARILADGERVYVPTTEEVASGVVPEASGGTGGPSGSAAGTVDINRADAAELETLPGIGPTTAQKIVDDREANGPFAKPEDLMRVPGIGPKKFEALRDLVTCG